MKNFFLAFLCLMTFVVTNAQSNKDIASVYIKRSEESLSNLEVKLSLEHFNKAMKYMDTITSSKVAKLGTFIHYELSNYGDAQFFAKKYFTLVKNKKTDEYLEFLELYVNINEEYEAQLEKDRELEKERIKKEKELQKIDSLKTIWNQKSESLLLKVDSIYTFNKNNLAIFKVNDFYGIITDKGDVLVEADEYQDVLSFDGFFIFKNKKEETTKIYCFNSNSKIGFLLPSPSDFNTLSTNYGKIMLPRGNGRLVTYPNNSYEPMVYDLNVKKNVKVANKEDLFKNLKKNDVIDKYNNDGELKINKDWYKFGGHLGGGIHPLYSENNYKVHSFLCSIDGKILRTTSNYQYIGAFYNNKFQALKDNKIVWINQNGTKVNDPKDESGVYTAGVKVVKLDNGIYQLKKDGFIILGNEKLEKMADFLRNNQ